MTCWWRYFKTSSCEVFNTNLSKFFKFEFPGSVPRILTISMLHIYPHINFLEDVLRRKKDSARKSETDENKPHNYEWINESIIIIILLVISSFHAFNLIKIFLQHLRIFSVPLICFFLKRKQQKKLSKATETSHYAWKFSVFSASYATLVLMDIMAYGIKFFFSRNFLVHIHWSRY